MDKIPLRLGCPNKEKLVLCGDMSIPFVRNGKVMGFFTGFCGVVFFVSGAVLYVLPGTVRANIPPSSSLSVFMAGESSRYSHPACVEQDFILIRQNLNSAVEALKKEPDYELALEYLSDAAALSEKYLRGSKKTSERHYWLIYNVYHLRALVYPEFDQYEESLLDANKAVRISRDYMTDENVRERALLVQHDIIDDYCLSLLILCESISDFSQLDSFVDEVKKGIELMPDNPELVNKLACLYKKAGRYEEALELFRSTGECSGCADAASFNIGTVHIIRGDYRAARDELKKTSIPGEMTAYRALFLFVAERRTGQDGKKRLANYAEKHKQANWPNPVFDLFLEEKSPDQFSSLLKKRYGNSNENLCEGYYFLAQFYMMRGKLESAIKYLKKTLETEVVEFNEYLAAREELKRLGILSAK